MRLGQPVGIFLLLWPCWWSLALAQHAMPSFGLLVLFAVGAVAMRSAGCIINDMLDRDFDRHVERTRTRPLASGEITMRQAAYTLLALLVLSLLIVLCMNLMAFKLAAFSLVLVASYPLMKRITWWPQAFLGITFNWGALMGWAAVNGDVALPAILLYIGGIFWTLGYDTIYAHQDKADDMRIGVKSTALRLGEESRFWITLFYVAAALLWAVAGITAGNNWRYYIGLMAVAAHFAWQLHIVNINDPANCLRVFRSNSVLGLILFLALVV